MRSLESTFYQIYLWYGALTHGVLKIFLCIGFCGFHIKVGIPSFVNLKTFRQATTEDERKLYGEYTAFVALHESFMKDLVQLIRIEMFGFQLQL